MRTLISTTIILHLVLLAAGCLMAVTVNAASIKRVNLDGSGLTTVVTDLAYSPSTIALDVAGGQMYWDERSNIQRANLNGTGVTNVLTGQDGGILNIALDVSGEEIYWTSYGDTIQRANLDGSGVTELVNGISAQGLALDVEGGEMYWTENDTYKVQKANLDGSAVTDLVSQGGVSGGDRLSAIALDTAGGQMYWGNYFGSTIQRANLDGSEVTDLVTGLDAHLPWGIALDVVGGHMYWAAWGSETAVIGTGGIRRSNLDGSGMIDVVWGLSDPRALALDLEAGHIYFTDGTGTAAITPLPPALLLFGSGLIGLLGVVRAKARNREDLTANSGAGDV